MTNEEAIKTINIAAAEVEWDYPMDYTVICDICGKEIDKGDTRIKAKMREDDSWVNEGLWEAQKWEKLDICTRCFGKMFIYIKTRGDEDMESGEFR